jgi:hypothetical protein
MIMQHQEPPPGWASDDLTSFIQMATDNIAATFHNKKRAFNALKDIDSYFQSIIDNLLNAPDFLASLLLLRTHSAYRAACRMSLSGQVPEAFVLLRSCIEYSLYALHINKNPEAGEKWINRHQDEEALKSAKNEFTYGRVIKTLETIDSSIYQTSRGLYERSIDFGAHPNERSITSSLKIIKGKDRIEFQQLYLASDGKLLSHGLKSTAQVGLCSLYILRHIFKERFDIIGVTQKMDKYRAIL